MSHIATYASILGHQKHIKVQGIIVPDRFRTYPEPGSTNFLRLEEDPLKNQKAYAVRLKENKQILMLVMQRKWITVERQALMLGMAMQETNTLSPTERDWTKDKNEAGSKYKAGAENFTIFNLNLDFINMMRPGLKLDQLNGEKLVLNERGSLDLAVELLDAAFSRTDWNGLKESKPYVQALNFHRGGMTGLAHPNLKYLGCADYRGAMQQMLIQIEKHPILKTDEQRVWIDLPHV